MKRADRYLLRHYIYFFGVSLVGLLVIFSIPSLLKTIDYISDGKLNAIQGLELFFSGIPKMVIDVTPLAVVLGGLITSNTLSTRLEIMSLKTSGVSFARIVMYPIILSFFIAGVVYWFNDNIVPGANQKRRELRYSEVYNVRDSRIKTDVYYKGEKNIYFIRLINGSEKSLKNMMVLIMKKDMSKIEKIITAQSGKYDEELKIWNLSKVKVNDLEKDKVDVYMNYAPEFLEETPNDFLRDKIREKEMSIKELSETIKLIKRTGGDAKKVRIALYEKIAYPFASFVICFIGLALGSRYVRGGSAISIALCIIIGYLYYVIKAIFEAVSIGGDISPFIASWIPNVIFLIIGIYFMKQAEY